MRRRRKLWYRRVCLPARWFCQLLVVLLLVASIPHAAIAADNADPIFDIPRVSHIAIDGSLAEWKDQGFEVRTLCCAKAMPWPKTTPAPSMRIGWDSDGLIVAVQVHHPHPWEFDYIRHLFLGDSVEFFVSPRKGSRDRYILVISPGLDPRYPDPRHCFFPDPTEEAERDVSGLTFKCARQKTDDGYTMEVLLPWSNLQITPTPGLELALQVYVMEAEPKSAPTIGMWQPDGETHINPQVVQRIRLSNKPSRPMLGIAVAQDDQERGTRIVRIVTVPELAGKSFALKEGDSDVMYGTLESRNGQGFATLDVRPGRTCQVLVDEKSLPFTVLSPAHDLTTIMTTELQCHFLHTIFTGEQFPIPYAEGAPHYHVTNTTYYDSNYQVVTTAAKPGRYGAIIDIADRKDAITRRFRTLFRLPDALGPWHAKGNNLGTLATVLAHDPDCFKGIAGTEDMDYLRGDQAFSGPDSAALLACIYEKQIGTLPTDAPHYFRLIDRQWWVGLKRKFYGWDKQFPNPFVCPTPLAGPPAPVLHTGTFDEAGVKSDKIDAIDQVCAGIVGKWGEPVSICLARHGVIFFSKAYGQVNGKPFTVDTPGDIMSATKPIGGALMTMVISQGLVGVDDPVAKYLPPFAGIRVKNPLTVRELYNHMSGLVGDWGDTTHDSEQVVAGYYPILDVGNYSYNEIGFALGGKIIEAATGEAFPQYAKRHLLAPLGMTHTTVTQSGGHNTTTALDYAKFGQMLLNKGAYGDMRFFTPAAFRQMLIPPPGISRGMGVFWLQPPGFGPGSFGHNAGNSSMFIVDPAHDLVLTIVSGGGGRKGFIGNADPFYQAVSGALK